MTEQERLDLYKQLTDWLGPVPAGTLMENLPPISWDQIATKDDVRAVKGEMAAQGTALRGEMSELRGDLRSEMSELRSDMSDFRTDITSELGDFRTEIRSELGDFRTELGDFRTEIQSNTGDFRTEINGRLGQMDARFSQLEERIGDKISAAQRANMGVAVAVMASIWLSIAAF